MLSLTGVSKNKKITAIDFLLNVKKILAVINATYAVAKRKPEKIRLAGIRTMTSAIPVQRSNQLSYQANWELVIKLVRNIPGKDEDEIMNI